MKKKLLLCFFISFYLLVYGQFPKTQIEVNSYYKENISQLKPIEGEYNVIIRVFPGSYARSMGITSTKTSQYQFWVYYSKNNGKYYVLHKFMGDKLSETGMKLIAIGTNRYSLSDEYGNITYIDTPDAFQLIDEHLSEHAITHYNFIKAYPTPEMYAQASSQASMPKEWSGTGFALNQGYLITNYHVVDGAGKITVQGVNGDFNTRLNAIIVASDRANDIALLRISDGRFSGFGNVPYQLRTEVAEVGESVFALGYPLASIMGDEIKFTDGRISSRTGVQGAVNVYQISVPIQPGNSGGPLFDQQGRIVGITSSSLNREMFSSENVNYAIKSGYILNLIDSSVGRNILPKGVTLRNMDITNKIKAAKNFVFYIQCEK